MQFECTCEADYKVDFCEIAVLFFVHQEYAAIFSVNFIVRH